MKIPIPSPKKFPALKWLHLSVIFPEGEKVTEIKCVRRYNPFMHAIIHPRMLGNPSSSAYATPR